LSSKLEALSSNPTTRERRGKERREKGKEEEKEKEEEEDGRRNFLKILFLGTVLS
jgi:ribosomal protein L12E/L44/L45/RPP1/RPP2